MSLACAGLLMTGCGGGGPSASSARDFLRISAGTSRGGGLYIEPAADVTLRNVTTGETLANTHLNYARFGIMAEVNAAAPIIHREQPLQ